MTDTIASYTGDASLPESLNDHAETFIRAFKKTTRFYVGFHILFAFLACAQFFALVVFFSFWIHSSTIAFLLAAIFLTGFSYFVLLFYFQVKKPQQFLEIHRIFVHACHKNLGAHQELRTYHFSIVEALYKSVDALDRMECDYYLLPINWQTMQILLRKFSIFCHWKDVLSMKELILKQAINEHIALIKEEPVDLQVHASLAENYIRLAGLYQKPGAEEDPHLFPWISPEYSSKEMQEKWRLAYARAIQEFSIMDAFAPLDPWVHAQLALIYHELGESKKESEQYEIILRIVPGDKPVLFKLGVLYFTEGLTAHGLRIYEQLKASGDPDAEKILEFYDALS